MRRRSEAQLKSWYFQKERRPLILRGARQVGKSTLVRLFCQREGLQLVEINLEKYKLKSIEVDDINLENLLTEIEDIHQTHLTAKNSLIFFDEIQAQPQLFKYLRYFFEDRPEYAVIAAGSLLEFYLSEESISVPVGRLSYYFLGPMDFEEYLLARGQKILLKRLKDYHNLSERQHQELMKFLKEFLFIGGMPSAVKTFIKTKSFSQVRLRQTEILQTYRDDFLKYSKERQLHILGKVFDFVPFNVGQKIRYSEIDSERRSIQIKEAIDLLIKARVVLPVYHTNASGLPLTTFEDPSIFKLYFLDVGLTLAVQDVNWKQMDQIFSELNQRGAMFEQFIAQHLMFRDKGLKEPSLHYWLKDKTAGKAELDFLFQEGINVFPVEVKSGASGSLKSLWQFIKEKKTPKAIQFYSGPLSIENSEHQQANENILKVRLYRVPHYLVCKLLRILEEPI